MWLFVSLGCAGCGVRDEQVAVSPRACRGTSLIRSRSPPKGNRRALCICPLKSPRGVLFRMSDVPLQVALGAVHRVYSVDNLYLYYLPSLHHWLCVSY